MNPYDALLTCLYGKPVDQIPRIDHLYWAGFFGQLMSYSLQIAQAHAILLHAELERRGPRPPYSRSGLVGPDGSVLQGLIDSGVFSQDVIDSIDTMSLIENTDPDGPDRGRL